MMTKKIFILTVTFLFSLSFFAQRNNGSRQKIKALKIAYITEQLNLSPEEAQKFWPIYNKFDKTKNELRSKNRFKIKRLIQAKGSIDSIDNKEAEKLITLKLRNEKALYETQKEFINKIKHIISHKKILKLQIAEMEFGRKLMRKYKRRK